MDVGKERKRGCAPKAGQLQERDLILNFGKEDQYKIDHEDAKTQKQWQVTDRELDSWEPTEDDDDEIALEDAMVDKKTGKRRQSKRAIKEMYEPLVANAHEKYYQWRKRITKGFKLKDSPLGDARRLEDAEKDFFENIRCLYDVKGTLRDYIHPFTEPPPSWRKRYNILQQLLPPSIWNIDRLIAFSKLFPDAPRNNWVDVVPVHKYPIHSMKRNIWSLLFTKCTNGVSDKNTCSHFRKLLQDDYPISLGVHRHPLELARILRGTSKWVKNTVSANLYY